MPLVNLIQEQRNEIRKRERQSRLFMLGSAAVVGFTFLTAGALMIQSVSTNDKVSRMQADIEKLQPMVGQYEENQERIAALQPRLTTLEGAQESTDRWWRILDHLTVHTPESVHFTNIASAQTQDDEPVQTTFRGMSGSQDAVGTLLLHLQLSEDMEEFSLKFTQEKRVENGSSIEFELSANVVGTAVEKRKKDEDKEASA